MVIAASLSAVREACSPKISTTEPSRTHGACGAMGVRVGAMGVRVGAMGDNAGSIWVKADVICVESDVVRWEAVSSVRVDAGRSVMSIMHISIQMEPTCGAGPSSVR